MKKKQTNRKNQIKQGGRGGRIKSNDVYIYIERYRKLKGKKRNEKKLFLIRSWIVLTTMNEAGLEGRV